MSESPKPLTRTEIKVLLAATYNALARVCEPSHEAARLLDRAFSAAQAGEKRHRRGLAGLVPRSYVQGVTTAAHYFVLKWFREPLPAIDSALKATQVREDCLYAMALRQLLEADQRLTPELLARVEACAVVDYLEHIVG